MILISSGLICEDEQVFSKARNNRAKTLLLLHQETNPGAVSLRMNGRLSPRTHGQFSARHYRMWTLQSSKGLLKAQLPNTFWVKKSLFPCQWGIFRLCQIRNFLVSSFRTEISCRAFGLNGLRSKEQYVISVVRLIALICDRVWITFCNCFLVLLYYQELHDLTLRKHVNVFDNPLTNSSFHF